VLDFRLPRAALLAAWGTAVLRGRTGIDHALDALTRSGETTRFSGLPGGDGADGLSTALGGLRRLGVTGLAYVPAASGDAAGLPGPRAFNLAAIARGGAVVTVDGLPLGLSPAVEESDTATDDHSRVDWQVQPVSRFATMPTSTLSEAERLLLTTLTETLDELERLAVDRWRDEANDLAELWRSTPSNNDLPPELPSRAYRLIGQGERMSVLLTVAMDDDGSSISGDEVQRRLQTLRGLQRVVRETTAVAWNSGLLEPSVR
jgi:hypothetical protein